MTMIKLLLVLACLTCTASAATLTATLSCNLGVLQVVVSANTFDATGVTIVTQNGIFVGNSALIPKGTLQTFTATTTTTNPGPAIVSATQNHQPITITSNNVVCGTVPNPDITLSVMCNVAGTHAPSTVCATITAKNTGNVPFTSFTLSAGITPALVPASGLPVGGTVSVTACQTLSGNPAQYHVNAVAIGTYTVGSSTHTKQVSQQFTCSNPFIVSPLQFFETCSSSFSGGTNTIHYSAVFTNPNPSVSFNQVAITKHLEPTNPSSTAVQNFLIGTIPGGGSTTISGTYTSPSNFNTFTVNVVDSNGQPHTFTFTGPKCSAVIG